MAASSSSSAAAEPRLPKHHVFLSFSGKDTRTKFTSHLYSALSVKYITYKDDVNLKIGDAISPALLEAIEESEISIIIFSQNYASSSWCLDELVHILKCKKEKDRIVLPIFIDIDPSHIRYQRETYAAAFEKHKERFKLEKVREWRQALEEAAGISGCVSGGKKSESEIVDEVVERVRRELNTLKSKRCDGLKGLVGIPEHLEKIKSFLDSPTVCIIGIWGMGGIGKTTLAKAVFDQFYNNFDGSCFAPNVRENAIKKGLDTLKTEVFTKLLCETNLDIFKSSAVDDRLSRTKALLVLDDVKDPMQFEGLVGDPYRFCWGSKIIVTSRDKLKVDQEYKVEELDSKDARKLFYLNAFGQESCRRGFEGISDRVVEYTNGLPLALKVLGASVFYFLESIEDWEKELKKLKRIPNDQIRKVLERSYDALDAEEKGLFLDIACFLKGQRRDFVEGILEDKPIRGLVDKSLITIEDDKIQMHDLIEEMGRDIVLRSTQKLGERSRLWIAEDVSDVLENNKGTEAIEGIYLAGDKEVHLRPDVFVEMRKLRLLIVYAASKQKGVCIDGNLKCLPNLLRYLLWEGNLKYLPNSLRYLHWEEYPGKSLPSNFKPQNLVGLHMPNSKLEQLWDGVQELGSLKHINLFESMLLTKIPDLSLAPKLEYINLSRCESLIHIPSLNLQATVDESAYRHQWLSVKVEAERTPGCIILNGCLGLTTLPKVSGNIRKLVLSRTTWKELPSSIESLDNLLHLDLAGCRNLKSLPKLPRKIEVVILDSSGIEQIPSSSFESLENLRHLDLRGCEKLKSLPKLPRNIEVVILDSSGIEQIPSSSFESLENLLHLDLRRCYILKSLPKLPRNIEVLLLDHLQELSKEQILSSIEGLCSLRRLSLCYCQSLSSLQFNINLKALEELEIRDTSIQELPSTIGMLYNLERICIDDCKNLQSLPASIGMLYKLKLLRIRNCENLRSLPASIRMLYKLKMLDIRMCKNLQSLPELPLLINYVFAEGCSSLEMVSSLRSTLTLGRWLDKYDSDNYQMEFSFLYCRKLGEDAINNIFREFLYKVFCTATTLPQVVVSKGVIREVVVCYPTKEIPRWFNNQSGGSSITITLPPNWYNPKTFLGFVVSVVVGKDGDDSALVEDEDDSALVEDEGEEYDCGDCGIVVDGLCLMTKKDCFRYDVVENYRFAAVCSDHMFMWYKYFDHSRANFEKYQEASFKFNCRLVKRCGVRMLYLKDAVEESDDGTTANFESWITYDNL